MDNEAIYEIAGSRSGKTHRVWVDLRLCTAACGCRAYLTEGVCGHADSALAAAKAAGVCGSSATAGRTSVASQEDADSLLSRAALRGRDALRDLADPSPCFQGLAAKSRSITEGGCFSGLRGRNRDPPPAVQDAQTPLPDGTPLKAVQAGRRNRSVPRRSTEPEVLYGERYIEAMQALLASGVGGNTLHVRAYSFNGAGYVEALELSLKNGARVRLIADYGQCSRTKLQWQTLRRLESQEAAVRLAQGTSIKSAYLEDNRDARVGGGLRGLHHAKSVLLEGPGGPELVAGSLNFTTSSKANAELGVKRSLPAGSNAAATWLTAFKAMWAESTSVEDAAERMPRGQRSKPTASSSSSQPQRRLSYNSTSACCQRWRLPGHVRPYAPCFFRSTRALLGRGA